MINIALFGPPGSGKGTQSLYLIENYGLKHLSPGVIFREAIKKESALGMEVAQYVRSGNLVPSELTVNIMNASIQESKREEGLLLDGYPRDLFQAKALDESLHQRLQRLDMVLFLEVPLEELYKRLEARRVQGRPDDQDESVLLHRMEVYQAQTLPVARYYGEQKKVIQIDGMGSIEEVSLKIKEKIDAIYLLKKEKNPSKAGDGA